MGTDVISIANRALFQIGARSNISNLNEGSTEANAINLLFLPKYQALARAARWNCLCKQAPLSLLKAAQGTLENQSGTELPIPLIPWLYEYAYPSDCLAVRGILPYYPVTASTAGSTVPLTTGIGYCAPVLPQNGQIPFLVSYDTDSTGNPIETILTNASQATAVYTVNQPNPVIWDSLFQEAMVATLAAFLVPGLSLNMALMQSSIAIAQKAIDQARAQDGNENVISQNREASWISARRDRYDPYANGYCNNSNVYNAGYGYCDMNWPGF